jgi:hypothetical protein
MAERTGREDFAGMLHSAACAVNDALRDGDRGGKHPPGSWQSETIDEQMRHIEAHITAYQCGDRNEDHLSHIVCRAVIAFALREMERGTDEVPEVSPMRPHKAG